MSEQRAVPETRCNGIRPFLMLGDDARTVVACIRRPGQHIGMDADCECCDCTAHTGPEWTSLRWNRETPGAVDAPAPRCGWDIEAFTCVPAVLVPVTQWDAVQRERAAFVAALEELAQIGDEAWRTRGHPMNRWVGRETVNRIATRALTAVQGIPVDTEAGNGD